MLSSKFLPFAIFSAFFWFDLSFPSSNVLLKFPNLAIGDRGSQSAVSLCFSLGRWTLPEKIVDQIDKNYD